MPLFFTTGQRLNTTHPRRENDRILKEATSNRRVSFDPIVASHRQPAQHLGQNLLQSGNLSLCIKLESRRELDAGRSFSISQSLGEDLVRVMRA